MRNVGKVWGALLAMALSSGTMTAHGQVRTALLDSLLSGHVYTFTLRNEHLAGQGADLIRDAARDAAFVLLGESHHSRAIPEFTVGLFTMLNQDGEFRHLAVEEGPGLGALLNRALRTPSSGGAFGVARSFPNAFHLLNESELQLFDRIGELSGAADPIWAVNQEFGLAHVYSRLAEIAPDQAARDLAALLLTESLLYEGERLAQDTSYIATIARPDDFEQLRAAFANAGDEAALLIEQAALSRAIYEPYRRGNDAPFTEYHASNAAREDNMKRLFSRLREEHVANGGVRPRVLIKSGHTHLPRGRNSLGVLTFGNFASEVARGEGAHTLHLYVVLNWDDLSDSWLAPLVAHIRPGSNTVLDLRHVEPWAVSGRIGSMDERLKQLLAGYDMLVVLDDTTEAAIDALCTPNFNWYTGIRGCG